MGFLYVLLSALNYFLFVIYVYIFQISKVRGSSRYVGRFCSVGLENTVQRAVGYAVESYLRVKLREPRILVNFIVYCCL